MLTYDPAQRITCRSALKHEFFQIPYSNFESERNLNQEMQLEEI